MSTREFFKERHTIPGSLFLLFIILINWNLVFSIIKENYQFLKIDVVSGIALVLFGTFGLTIIGFIISQIWFGLYWLIGRRLGFRIMGPKNPAHKFLRDVIKIKPDQNTLQAITDYFGIVSEEKISGYLNRRLDLVHTISSSVISIMLAHIISIGILQTQSNIIVIVFSVILIIFMIISCINIHLENLKMVEYILLIDYKKRYKFWEKIPKEYLNPDKKN